MEGSRLATDASDARVVHVCARGSAEIHQETDRASRACPYCGGDVGALDYGRPRAACLARECRIQLEREHDRARRRREARAAGRELAPGVCPACCYELAQCRCVGAARQGRP